LFLAAVFAGPAGWLDVVGGKEVRQLLIRRGGAADGARATGRRPAAWRPPHRVVPGGHGIDEADRERLLALMICPVSTSHFVSPVRFFVSSAACRRGRVDADTGSGSIVAFGVATM